MLDFLKRVVNGLGVSPAPDGARVGIIRFTSTPSISLYFNTIRDENLTPNAVNKFIDPITQIQGDRRIDLALQRAATVLFTGRGGSRPNAKKVVNPGKKIIFRSSPKQMTFYFHIFLYDLLLLVHYKSIKYYIQ